MNSIRLNGQPIPLVALIGTRGGVGKSTIAQYFAEMVLSAPGRDGRPPNVLLIDLDVHSRQTTQHYRAGSLQSCPTIHQLVQQDLPPNFVPMNVTSQVPEQAKARLRRGELYLVPSASSQEDDVYKVAAKIPAEQMADLLTRLIQQVVVNNQISCVILDCTAHIDTYAAAAASIADAVLCTSLVEQHCFERCDEQGRKIRSQVPSFDPERVKPILNRYRHSDRLQDLSRIKPYYHAIPFSDEVIDGQDWPGAKVDELRLAIFKDYVGQLIEKVLKPSWPGLVPPPSVMVPAEVAYLASVAHKLFTASGMKRLSIIRHLVWLGVVLLVFAIAGLYRSGNMMDATVTTGQSQFFGLSRQELSNGSLLIFLLGGLFMGVALWARMRYKKIINSIQELIQGREIWVMRQMESGSEGRITVGRLMRLAFQLKEAREFIGRLR